MSTGGDLSNSTGDVRDRDVLGSPLRCSTSMGRRSAAETEDEDEHKKGMGLKEMEKVRMLWSYFISTLMTNFLWSQTVSTLHKQNFDLKLELYHRRERQDELEEKLETVQAENNELKEMRQVIDTELEKRDKAIAEAVAMIVRLEEQVSDLVREKEIVRFVESDTSYCHPRPQQVDGAENSGVPLTPKMKSLELFGVVGGGKTLERVPSFLSERSEQTENLRNVVLSGRTNHGRMRRVSEASAEPNDLNRVGSPSLSMLSESSFVSVYGSKDGNAESSPDLDDADATAIDNTPMPESPTPVNESNVERWRSQRSSPASWMQKTIPKGGASLTGQLQPVSKVIDVTSPLQKIEMLEKQFPNVMDVSRSSTPSYNRNTPTASPRTARPKQGPPRQEKRSSVHKIVTGGPTSRELANSHILPPTPDTVASSTLRKHQEFSSSQDSLGGRPGLQQQSGFPPVSEVSDSSSFNNKYRPSQLQEPGMQRASTSAFTGRQGLSMPPIATEWLTRPNGHTSMDLPPRPRSAGETTLSRARANSWISDSDSDSGGGADARSEESAFDYWMRESIRPDTKHGHARRPDPRKDDPVRSPDLFSFPADSGGWGTDAIFGAMNGNDFLGAPIPSLKRERIDDMTTALGASQTTQLEPQQMGYAPPTPNRKSSLHAHTGSLSVSASPANGGGRSGRGPPALNSALNRITRSTKSRSNSIDSVGQSLQQYQQHPPEAPSPASSKRSPYPPISGLGMRRSLGLNTLFRRSGTEAPSSEAAFPPPPQPAEGAAAQFPPHVQMQFAAARASGRSSVPPPPRMPWAMRPSAAALIDDELDRATPPPIARSRGQSLSRGASTNDESMNDYSFTPQQLQQQLQEEMTIAEEFGMANRRGASTPAKDAPPSSPAHAPPASPSPASPAGSRRSRWLNLGRMSSSLKNRSA